MIAIPLRSYMYPKYFKNRFLLKYPNEGFYSESATNKILHTLQILKDLLDLG